MRKVVLIIAALIVLVGCSNMALDDDSGTVFLTLGETYSSGGVSVTFTKAYFLTNDPIFVQEPNRIALDVSIGNSGSSAIEYSVYDNWGTLLTDKGEQLESMISLSANNASYFQGYQILPGAIITDTMSFYPYTSHFTSARVIGTLPFGLNIDYELLFFFDEITTKAPTE